MIFKSFTAKLFDRIKTNRIEDFQKSRPEFPTDFQKDEIENISAVAKFTMTSHERLIALSRAVDYIVEQDIPGDIVECGVWRGGSMMLAAQRLMQHKSQSRNLFLFDTFEGMTEPTNSDKDHSGESAADLLRKDNKENEAGIWCIANLSDVEKNVLSTGYDRSKIHFIKGRIELTLPFKQINKIAILRLDTDWYESTRHELNTLYDNVAPGGVIIIDDYGHWDGCKKAVDEFIKSRELKVYLHRIDYTGRIFVKP